MLMRTVLFVAAFAAIVLSAGQAMAVTVNPELTNPDFSAGLTGWRPQNDVEIRSGYAHLTAGVFSGDATLTQCFVLPAKAESLSFDYNWGDAPGQPGPAEGDFCVWLRDVDTGLPLLGTNPNAFADNEGARWFVSGDVSADGNRVTLDLSGIHAPYRAELGFELGCRSLRAELYLAPLELLIIPEPMTMASIPLALAGLVGYLRRRAAC